MRLVLPVLLATVLAHPAQAEDAGVCGDLSARVAKLAAASCSPGLECALWDAMARFEVRRLGNRPMCVIRIAVGSDELRLNFGYGSDSLMAYAEGDGRILSGARPDGWLVVAWEPRPGGEGHVLWVDPADPGNARARAPTEAASTLKAAQDAMEMARIALKLAGADRPVPQRAKKKN